MKIRKAEIPKLIAVYAEHKKGLGLGTGGFHKYQLPDFDYLRGCGLLQNGLGNSYGVISLTEVGVKFCEEKMKEAQGE